MNGPQKSRLFAYAVCLVVAALGIRHAININVPSILAWDILGYYLYLPLTFVTHDIGLHSIEWLRAMFDQYDLPGTIYQVNLLDNGNWAIRYSSGWAVMYLPFFLIGHAVATMGGHAIDGFSTPYQWAMFSGSLFYFGLGAVLLMRILLRWFSVAVAVITFLAIFLGTNYLHVNTSSAGMPHVHLFALYAALILITDKWHTAQGGKWNSLLLGTVIGLIALTRPSDVICAIIPLLWGVSDLKTLQDKYLGLWERHKADLLVVIITVGSIGMVQILYWLVVTGKPIYHGYDQIGEGLDLMFPHTLDFLFSFRKGWFVYTPMMLLAVVGFVLLRKDGSKLFVPALLFSIGYIYLVSSWTNWWYADSFSQRPMMHVYAILALPLAAYVRTAVSGKWWMLAPIPVFLLLNILQTWQTEQGIIHTSRMTLPYYKAVFLKDYMPSGADKLLLVNRENPNVAVLADSVLYTEKKVIALNFDANDQSAGLVNDTAFSGCCSLRMNGAMNFTPAIESRFDDLTRTDHAWLEVSCMIRLDGEAMTQKPTLVMHYTHQDSVYHYFAMDVSAQLPNPGQWFKVKAYFLTPEPRRRSDPMRTYGWLQGQGQMHLDDLTVRVLERIPITN